MIRKECEITTEDFEQNSLRPSNVDIVRKRRTAPEPPADKRGLIGPREVAQMTDRKRQIAALRAMIAAKEGSDDGR